jgi:hypothetical protein
MPLAINYNSRTAMSRPESNLVKNMSDEEHKPSAKKFGRNHNVKVKKGKGKQNDRNHRAMSSFGSNQYGNNDGYGSSIDLHNSALHQAKDRIKDAIRDAYSDSMPGVTFNHGFNNGIAIRDWLRSDSFQQFMDSKKIPVNIWHNNEGSTNVSFGKNN